MNDRHVTTISETAHGRRPLVAALTLGCKLNQAETQGLARELEAAGCVVVDRPAPADGYLINTCTVTHVADRKARRLVRLARRLSPAAPVVVTGCYADWASGPLSAAGASRVLPNATKHTAGRELLRALGQARPDAAMPQAPRAAMGRARAFVKIQEGCDDVCAFCIVPRVRGRERAVPIGAVVREAQEREAAGALEVVLTGTQPGAYGRDRDDGSDAASLIEALLQETTLPRIRYSSIQPQDVTDALLRQWEDARMCRHFHLALQSGSDAVLRRMRRRYSLAEFRQALARIRAAVPGVAITTDVIVGFPGESEAEFAASRAAVAELGFADVHVFPYSARPRTSAALLADDVPPEVKRARVSELQALADAQRRAFRSTLVGTVAAVLVERAAAHGWLGLTDTYVPVHMTRTSAVEASAAHPVELTNRLVTAQLMEPNDGGAVQGRVIG